MLVLTRKENESIMVGDQIEIVITKVDSDRVKVGINAPSYVSVHRKEVYEDIKRENTQAVKIDMNALQQASQALQKKAKDPG
jgi:carbon storage regulator